LSLVSSWGFAPNPIKGLSPFKIPFFFVEKWALPRRESGG
jgi:hypothetical protein